MSESILTASYRNTSISDSERQSIINAAVAAVDSSKPRYKDVYVDISLTRSSDWRPIYAYFSHGMKLIQTATFMATSHLEFVNFGGSEFHKDSGWEAPITTTPLLFLGSNSYCKEWIYYDSSRVILQMSSSDKSYKSTGTGVVRFYGTY